MSDGGKGSTPRPFDVDYDTFSNNWDKIFGKDKKKNDVESQKLEQDKMDMKEDEN